VLRFRLGPIPVTVHLSHLLMSGLIAWTVAPVFGPSGTWPRSVLADPSHPQRELTLGLVVGVWLAIVSLSVLAHELGHAVAATSLGYPGGGVQLVGLGGLGRGAGGVNGASGEAMPWREDVLSTLAGPAAGLALGVVAGAAGWAWERLGDPPALALYVLLGIFYANLVWTALNLVPLASLDGGRITATVLTRLVGRPGFLAAQVVSLALAAALLALAAAQGDLFLAALVLLLGLRTFANISAYNQGLLPQGEGGHPLLGELKAADAELRAGHYADAQRLARNVLAAEPPQALRGRAHLVLGWVSLKQGQGPGALQHFTQAKGLPVPAQALAAAYSLSGDEGRALPLWVAAARQHPDELLLHELAGSLIRAGRELEARRLPGVRPALAFAAAERVLSLRGEHALAAQAAEGAFREEPAAARAYEAACAWARAGDAGAALRMLTLASQNGFGDAEGARGDPDLASLRGRPDFEAWLGSLPLSAGR
jgi:Zn-dependent protease